MDVDSNSERVGIGSGLEEARSSDGLGVSSGIGLMIFFQACGISPDDSPRMIAAYTGEWLEPTPIFDSYLKPDAIHEELGPSRYSSGLGRLTPG